MLATRVARQSRLDELGTQSGVGRAQLGQRVGQIEPPAFGGGVKDSDRANNPQSASARGEPPRAVVHQNDIRADLFGKAKRFPFAGVQIEVKLDSVGLFDAAPGGERSGPLLTGHRRVGLLEFLENGGRNQDLAEQSGQNGNCSHKIR